MQLIKASKEFGIRPSALILETDSRKPWGKWDILIATAYQIMLDELCPICGNLAYICQNEDSDIRFKIDTISCSAKKAEEDYRNPSRGRKGSKPREIPEWERIRATPYSESGRELIEFRKPFYKSMADKAEGQPPRGGSSN